MSTDENRGKAMIANIAIYHQYREWSWFKPMLKVRETEFEVFDSNIETQWLAFKASKKISTDSILCVLNPFTGQLDRTAEISKYPYTSYGPLPEDNFVTYSIKFKNQTSHKG